MFQKFLIANPSFQLLIVYSFALPVIFLSTVYLVFSSLFELIHYLFARSPKKEEQNILITGASSGIGAQLAIDYSKPGVYICLAGRNKDRLNKVAKICVDKGARVDLLIADVTDISSFERQILNIDSKNPFDLVIANAGISANSLRDSQKMDQDTEFTEFIKPLIQVNFIGAIATVQPLLERFLERKSGQIAIVSSLGGIASLPTSPTYSSTKAALNAFCTSLRPYLAKENVKLSVICPGLIRTNMTKNIKFKEQKSFFGQILASGAQFLSVEEASSLIIYGLQKDVALIAFPFNTFAFIKVISLLPLPLQTSLQLFLMGKGLLPRDEF